MTISGAMTYNRYRVRRNTTEPGFSFEARNDQVSQTLLIPGLDRLNPLDLFRNGQPGGFADPYDLTKMWIDDAGTTPATIASLGTGIGRVQTKGGPVITFTQANAADRPVWGRHPVSGARQLLTFSEQFDNAAWSKADVTVTANTTETLDPFGENFADKLVETTDNSVHSLRQSVAINTGATITMSVYAKAAERGFIRLWEDVQTGHQAFFNLNTGVATNVNMSSVSMTNAGNGWWRCSGTVVSATGASRGMRILVTQDGSNSAYAGTAGSGVFIHGAQVVEGTTATPYQRATNRFDITEVGSPSLYYFSFNGVNQSWASNATVDFSGTNKVTVWAGLRSLSNAGTQTLLELSAFWNTNNGSWVLGQNASAAAWQFGSRGSTTSVSSGNVAVAASPATYSLVGEGDIAGPLSRLRTGATIASSTTSQGTGNYGNYTVFIGRRAGTSNPCNLLLYSLLFPGGSYDSRTISRFADWTLKPRRLITA